jgi:archaeosortase B (VPXXXP-CTERM-specific)
LSDESQPVQSEGQDSPGNQFGGWGDLIKHWALFLGILGLAVAFSEWQANLVNIEFSKLTAKLMAISMTILGENGRSVGVNVGSDVCKFTIIGECTAYYPIAIFIAAVLAFPSPWLRRIFGVVLGVPALLVINQVRLVSLCYIERAIPEHFDVIHIVGWQSLIIFFTVLLWILWVTTFARRP